MDITVKDLRELHHLSAFYIWCQKIKDLPLQNPSKDPSKILDIIDTLCVAL